MKNAAAPAPVVSLDSGVNLHFGRGSGDHARRCTPGLPVEALRPAPRESVMLHEMSKVVGRRLRTALAAGQCLTWDALAEAEAC